MKTFDELILVNYCYPDCIPLMNIMRLPQKEAYVLASVFAESHPETTAFYRFADFENYYLLREKQDEYLYSKFIELGGLPEEKHPLSFVIEGSDYLRDWFGNGIESRLRLGDIQPCHISFTIGDSGAEYQKNGSVELLTLKDLKDKLLKYGNDYEAFIKATGKHYVEVQLWTDRYITKEYLIMQGYHMMNPNVYFLLGCPCAGKTTIGNILAQKYNVYYFSGDNRRFDYYKLAEKEKHPFMTMDASGFWEWSLDEMVAWEKGVISEQTPYILNDLNELSKDYDMILFEGMLDLKMVSKVVPDNQIVYLSVDKSVCEREFFARETHRGMIDNILSTPGISDEEKQRRIMMRKGAAINAFYENAKEFGIQTFMRDMTTTAQEMAEKVEKHFGLKKHG